MPTSPTVWAASISVIMNASHLICSRTSRPPARKRTASDTAAAANSGSESTPSPLRVPTSTVDHTGPSELTPSGFGNEADTPPGAGRATIRGCTANPASARPVAAIPNQPTGRQRRDGSRPSGNSRNVAMNPAITSTNVHSANSPTRAAPGRPPPTLEAVDRVSVGDILGREQAALAEQQPADHVSRPPHDERSEAGVVDPRQRRAEVGCEVPVGQVPARQQGQGSPGEASAAVTRQAAISGQPPARGRRAQGSGAARPAALILGQGTSRQSSVRLPGGPSGKSGADALRYRRLLHAVTRARPPRLLASAPP